MSGFSGNIKLTESNLLGTWQFDTLSGDVSNRQLRLTMIDSRRRMMTFLDQNYNWTLDGNYIKGTQLGEDALAYESAFIQVKSLNNVVFADSTSAILMRVDGYVASHRNISDIDTFWTFQGTLYKQ
jgi:hypothetical protein